MASIKAGPLKERKQKFPMFLKAEPRKDRAFFLPHFTVKVFTGSPDSPTLDGRGGKEFAAIFI